VCSAEPLPGSLKIVIGPAGAWLERSEVQGSELSRKGTLVTIDVYMEMFGAVRWAGRSKSSMVRICLYLSLFGSSSGKVKRFAHHFLSSLGNKVFFLLRCWTQRVSRAFFILSLASGH
jgi:hypothetical protein